MLVVRLFFIFFFAPLFIFSQNVSVNYSNSLSQDSIHIYVSALTSDSMAGRETGQTGQKIAANFLLSKYLNWRIPVRLQKHPLNVRANSGKNLVINDQYFVYYQSFFYVSQKHDSLFQDDKILVAGFGIKDKKYDDFKRVEVSEKTILVRWAQPNRKNKSKAAPPTQANSLSRYVTNLLALNPTTIFIAVNSLPQLILEVEANRDLYKLLEQSKTPVIFINLNTAEKFFSDDNKNLYKDYLTQIETKRKPKPLSKPNEIYLKVVANTDEMVGENVLAYIEGKSKKDECLIVSGHYDHLGIKDSLIYYGADDNASGTSALLEMARVFQKAKEEGNGPERSVLFINMSGEEKGLLGSLYYVKHPLVPLENTVADLNIDMIGRVDEKHDSLKIRDYIYLIGADRLSKELAEINTKINTENTKLELDLTYDNDTDPNRYYQRSDHFNFAKNNIPVIFYFNGTHEDYHRPTDTPDKIDASLIRKRAQLVFLTAWELINREERIKLNKQ